MSKSAILRRPGAPLAPAADASKLATLSWPTILLCIGAALAVLIGGQVPVDTGALNPGLGSALGSIAFGSEAPIAQHWVIGLCFAVVWLYCLVSRRVVQLPPWKLMASTAAFFAIIVLSTLGAVAKSASFEACCEWMVYGIAFAAVVAASGRTRGPVAIIAAIFGACVVLSVIGIVEYSGVKAVEPTHRIFSRWNNPNALGSILVVGFLLGIGLAVSRKQTLALAAGVGAALIGFALLLTQSKGAIGVALLGSVAMAAYALATTRPFKHGATLAGRIAAILAVVAVMGIGLQAALRSGSGAGGAQPFGRLENAGQSAVQSVGFRKDLQSTAVALIRSNVSGDGIGCFQYDSARPGIVMHTVMAHCTLLQLAVEASPIAPVLLLISVFLWLYYCVKSSSKLPPERNLLRASVVAALCCLMIDGVFESNLYYFGLGVVFFCLLGLGLLLAADAPVPELAPKPMRWMVAVATAVVVGALAVAAIVEIGKANVRFSRASGDIEAAKSSIETLKSLAPNDGEVAYLAGTVAADPRSRIEEFRRAVGLTPVPKYVRTLARTLSDDSRPAEAAGVLRQGLLFDPNNLFTLLQLIQAEQASGDPAGAIDTAKRLVAVESTNYYRVRAIPELVPTETLQARVFLASQTDDLRSKAELLQGAVYGFLDHARTTIPLVKRFAQSGLDYGGEDLQQAMGFMKIASEAAKSLSATYRVLGEPGKAEAAESAGGEFDAALAAGDK